MYEIFLCNPKFMDGCSTLTDVLPRATGKTKREQVDKGMQYFLEK